MSKQAELIPISPDVLRWARESLGLSVSDVANRLKKDVSLIQEWENGVSLPTYPQLEDLAYKIYKRPLAVFFMSKPPAESSLKQEFRNIPNHLIETLPKDFRLIVRQVKYYQLALEEIYTINQSLEAIHKFLPVNEKMKIPEIAGEIRSYLDLSYQDIKKISDFDKAFQFYRDNIEQKGIFIFQDKLGDIDGFCLYHNEFPAICVNSSHVPQKKIFTIFHELAHILLHANDIAGPDAIENDTEIFCNKLSAEILIPTQLFLQETLIQNHHGIIWTSDDISSLAKIYKVSRESILRKILDMKLTTNEYYRLMVKTWADEYNQKSEENSEKPKESIIVNPHTVKKSRLGKNFIKAIITAYHDNKIDMLETAKILKTKVEYINEYENIS